MSIPEGERSAFDHFNGAPRTTMVVGAGAHELGETMASALASDGEIVRTLQLKTTEQSQPMTPTRVVQRLRPEFVDGDRRSSHVFVSCDASHAMSVLEALLRLQLSSVLRLDGLVVTVDGPTASTRLLTDQAVVADDWTHVLAIADRILVGRAELLTPQGLDGVAWSLRNGNRLAPISFPALGGVDIGAIAGIDAWVGELAIGPSGPPADCPCSTWHAVMPSFAGLSDVVHVVQQLLLWCSGDILRLQGVIPILDGESVLVSGSGATALTMTARSIPGENGSLTIVTPRKHTDTVRNVLRTLVQTHSVAESNFEQGDR